MTVCRYFLNGNCRYGQNCRFEHTYDNSYRPSSHHQHHHSNNNSNNNFGGGGSNYSNYHYNNPQQQSSSGRGGSHQQGGSSFNFGQAALEVAANKSQELNQVKQDLLDMIEGRFYPFTVIPGATNLVNFSHLSDLSPEEIRLKAYESLATNSFQDYQAEMARHLNHVMQIMRQLIANPQLIQESQARPIAGPVVHSATPPFDHGMQSQGIASIFQPQSSPPIFPQPGFGTRQVQGPSPTTGPGFGPGFSNPFAQDAGVFNQHSTSPHFPGHTTQGGPMQIPPSIMQSPFAIPTVAAPSGVTGAPSQPGRSDHPSSQQVKDTTYTPMESLSADDLAAFRHRVFTLDNLPLVAPPKELCN